jgi:hypothetical protein
MTLKQWKAQLPKNMKQLKAAEPNSEFKVTRGKRAGKPEVTIFRTFGGEKVAGVGPNTERAIFDLYRKSRQHHEDYVLRALAQGLPVPENVLKDYPGAKDRFAGVWKTKRGRI